MQSSKDESPMTTHTENNQLLPEEKTAERKYDYYKVPANLQDAKRHGLAKRVYVDGEREKELCLCCGFQVGEKIPMKASVEQLFHLGVGYPTYFEFIRHTTSLLIAMFVLSGIYGIASNVAAGDCSSSDTENESAYCVKGYILSFTITNKRDSESLLIAQLALNLLSIVAVMFLLHYVRLRLRKINFKADSQAVTSSDYTIEIQNVPADATEKDIREWILSLEERCGKLEIEKIVRPYAINQYIELTNERSALRIHLAELSKVRNQKNVKKMAKVEEKINDITQKIQDLREPGKLKKCTLVYITFKTAQQAESVRYFRKNVMDFVAETFFSPKDFASYQFKENTVQVRRAPEPVDILWKNLEYSQGEKFKVRMFSLGVTIVVIAISFGLIILVNWGQGEYIKKNGNNSSVVQILSIVASLIIAITNAVLGIIIEFLAQYEKHETYTRYLSGITQKLAIAQFLNTALINLLSQLILASSDSISNRLQSLNFYGKGGLLENMFWVFITNALVAPSITYFDPLYYWKLFNQYLAERKGAKNKLTQMEANVLYEGPPLDMPKKYAGLIKVVLLTTFYASAIPFAYIFTIVGLIAWFWADKYVLLRRFALPQAINNDLTDSMVEYLEWSTVTFAIGNLIFFYTLKNKENEFAFPASCSALVWVTFGLCIAYVFFPMGSLNAKLFPDIEKAAETDCFEEAQIKFHTDYEITNPLTRKKALRNHLKRKSDTLSGKRLETRQTEEPLDFEALDDYAIKVEENKLKSTPNQNVEQLPKGVQTALQQFMSLRIQMKHHNPEQDGEDPDEARRQKVDRMVRSVFQSFRERKLRREQEGEDMNEIRLNVEFSEKSDPKFRSQEVNREMGTHFFAHK